MQPLEDREAVDARRAALGMSLLDEDLALFDEEVGSCDDVAAERARAAAAERRRATGPAALLRWTATRGARLVTSPAELADRLRRHVAAFPSAAVAFSAGVDSTLVLAVAHEVLGDRALGVTGISPSVAPAEAADARRVADALGAALVFVETAEMDDPNYVANPPNRCFFCKTELYAVTRRVADERGLAVVLNGTNADDASGRDWRPGLVAADEAGVRSPLAECGLAKTDVRAVAEHLGLPNWDKPALACLASRLPYGTAVTPQRLAAVDRVERWLRGRGFRDVRARFHGDRVRLEVEAESVPRLVGLAAGPELAAVVDDAGFSSFDVEADGFRSGRLNDELPRPTPNGETPR